jgi:hypothetical protein
MISKIVLTFLLFSILLFRPGKAQVPAFLFEPDMEHCLLLVLSETWADLSEVSAAVVQYNLREYPKLDLKVSRLRMPYLSAMPVLYIRSFKDASQAMAYYERLQREKPDFMQMNMVKAAWPLSNYNYNEVVLNKTLGSYPAFFQKYYLKTVAK